MADEWRPGSFTKNYSWGPLSDGLMRLHEAIKVGFDGRLEDTTRAEFRERISRLGRPDFIPLNFFLYNEVRNGESYVVVDELVFQALSFPHGSQFDKLALYTFALSEVGKWKGAKNYQARPALWAKHYVADQVGKKFSWNAKRITADDIQLFVENDARYTGQTTRKLATNLNYLFRAGRIDEFNSPRPERWWLSAIFLTLDRSMASADVEFGALGEARLVGRLVQNKFWEVSGKRSSAKDIALVYFTSLYAACGGRLRFSDQAVLDREKKLVPERASNEPPDSRAVGVFHPSNPTARNALPHACRVLARYLAGFELFEMEEWNTFDFEGYIHNRTADAIKQLRDKGLRPSMSADELTKLLRD